MNRILGACTLLFVSVSLKAEEAIDLSTLGASKFNPYVFERAVEWCLFPLFMISVILWHTKRSPYKIKNPFYEEIDDEKETGAKDGDDNVLPFTREG